MFAGVCMETWFFDQFFRVRWRRWGSKAKHQRWQETTQRITQQPEGEEEGLSRGKIGQKEREGEEAHQETQGKGGRDKEVMGARGEVSCSKCSSYLFDITEYIHSSMFMLEHVITERRPIRWLCDGHVLSVCDCCEKISRKLEDVRPYPFRSSQNEAVSSSFVRLHDIGIGSSTRNR